MKKFYFLLLYSSISGFFSQSNKQIIQNYLNGPEAKSNKLSRELSDWAIQSEGNINY
jgi:hypothetical protein